MFKILSSLIAMMIGWAAGFGFYVYYMTFYSKWGRPTDQEAILFWTGVFIFLSWLIFFLPLVIKCNQRAKLFQVHVFPIFGAMYGLLAFHLLVGWWTGFWPYFLYNVYAMVVGVVAGLCYSISLRLCIDPRRVDE